MFTKEQIDTIFINLEDILKFQTAFLKDLEACINWEAPYKSCVGSCFLKHRAGKVLVVIPKKTNIFFQFVFIVSYCILDVSFNSKISSNSLSHIMIIIVF